MGVGKRIRALRLSRGFTQVELSFRAGITQGSLSAIERGHSRALKADTILSIASVLETSPEWLQTGKGPPTPPVNPNPDEGEALHILRALPKRDRATWLTLGRAMLDQAGTPSVAAPFIKSAR